MKKILLLFGFLSVSLALMFAFSLDDFAKIQLYKITYNNFQEKQWLKQLYITQLYENQSLYQYKVHSKIFKCDEYEILIKNKTSQVNTLISLLSSYKRGPVKGHLKPKRVFNIKDAFRQDKTLEEKIIIQYQWLIENSKNKEDVQILRKAQRASLDQFETLVKSFSKYKYIEIQDN